MPRFRARDFLPPAWVVWILIAALANPLCCHLMPGFQAEPPPEETHLQADKGLCAGKPEAVRDAPLVWAAALAVISAPPRTFPAPPTLRLPPRTGSGDPPGPARSLRILFRVFRI